MRHRVQLLLATAALATALAPVVAIDRPTPPGVIRGTQAVRHALMQAGRHFYRLSDIIGGINWHHQLTL
ncbi:hypothetical protein ACU635_19880 [[Actinomadura] parvosata]|uniref:Uncharacterized protein n=1 Tax=Nonomuraea composti TaxID=2720023 RepID=A0ABX1AW57_9ACTN|nr:hypothetical protein [Nonomuraea sp. FMUSA5-5]NJP89141.1 hypothetical protein [Nonomuraea sp. FMUSA5-5]